MTKRRKGLKPVKIQVKTKDGLEYERTQWVKAPRSLPKDVEFKPLVIEAQYCGPFAEGYGPKAKVSDTMRRIFPRGQWLRVSIREAAELLDDKDFKLREKED